MHLALHCVIAIAPAVLGCLCSLFRFVSSFVSVHCWSGVQLALADVRWRVREWNFRQYPCLTVRTLPLAYEALYIGWWNSCIARGSVAVAFGFGANSAFVTSCGGICASHSTLVVPFAGSVDSVHRTRGCAVAGAPRPCLWSLVRLIHAVS